MLLSLENNPSFFQIYFVDNYEKRTVTMCGMLEQPWKDFLKDKSLKFYFIRTENLPMKTGFNIMP